MCISAFEGEGKSESAAMNAAVRAVEGIFFLLGFETSWYRVSQLMLRTEPGSRRSPGEVHLRLKLLAESGSRRSLDEVCL